MIEGHRLNFASAATRSPMSLCNKRVYYSSMSRKVFTVCDNAAKEVCPCRARPTDDRSLGLCQNPASVAETPEQVDGRSKDHECLMSVESSSSLCLPIASLDALAIKESRIQATFLAWRVVPRSGTEENLLRPGAFDECALIGCPARYSSASCISDIKRGNNAEPAAERRRVRTISTSRQLYVSESTSIFRQRREST